MTRRIGWLDCSAGAAGDMLLAALVGAGVPPEIPARAVAALGLPVHLDVVDDTHQGFAVHRALVTAEEPAAPRRSYFEILAILEGAPLEPTVRRLAANVFGRLAEAEARVHATTVDAVHFHEVGALDALADVVGCAAGFDQLALDDLVVSPIALGSGRAEGEHGTLPVPVPAVLELLRETELLVSAGTADFEQCTPTAAAVLSVVATRAGGLPDMAVDAVGVGAGTRLLRGGANVVRLVVGHAADGAPVPTGGVLLSTNVDDLDPRVWPSVLERLLAAGASDAWLTPILMKKGRPAHTLSVLCRPDVVDQLRRIVVRETSTIGWREHAVAKWALDREEAVVQVEGGPVRIKIARLDGAVVNAQPEYDDVAAAADSSGRPAKVVLAEAIAAIAEQPDAPR